MSIAIHIILGGVMLLGSIVFPTIVEHYQERKKIIKIKVPIAGREKQEMYYEN
jgi:Trk-type K+ transport system membrane component